MVIKLKNVNGTHITISGNGNCMGYNILVREPNLRVCKIILKKYFKKWSMWVCTKFILLRLLPRRLYEHGNEPSDYLQGVKFLDHRSHYQLLKDSSHSIIYL